MKSTMVKEINGQMLTQDSVIEVHEKLVHHVCKRFYLQADKLGLEYGDILSVGFIGLFKAFQYFDGDKFNVRFSTYAVPMIRGEIQRFLLNQNPGLRYPRTIKDLAFQIHTEDLQDSQIEDIANTLSAERWRVIHALNFLSHRVLSSLDESFALGSEGDAEITVLNQVASVDDPTKLFVDEFVSSLTEMEQQIVRGLLQGEKQMEIAEKIGVCQVSVSRYQKKIRVKYLAYFNNENPVLALA